MSYLALYRKYRPKTFDEVIGQNHITQTLSHQVETGAISHAYLFTGTRGTGKTSCAKIFAKAINCLHPVNGSPCGECDVCKELNNPANMDILEIDAASNNRVDEIRDLREKVKYPPVNAKYKVYIIDEVHMLTDSAFNALLKTLEEPPKHVVFILATTEVQKLPATILSRCMRFDFKLIDSVDLSKQVKAVYEDSGITFEEPALDLIANAGLGSSRDTLSIADMVASFCGNNVTFTKTLQVLGSISKETIISLSQNILDKDVNSFISLLTQILNDGKSVNILAKDLTTHFRDLILIKNSQNANLILNYPQDIYDKLKKQSEGAEISKLLSCLEKFGKAEQILKYSSNPKMAFETVCLESILTEYSFNLQDINNRFDKIEQKIEQILKNE